MSNNEIEIIGELTQKQFAETLKKFRYRFGKPRLQKRFAVKIYSLNQFDVDTRIKITNGNVHLVQKIGESTSAISERKEIDININLKAKEILNLIRVVINTRSDHHTCVQQFENYLFDTPDLEIKLADQFGPSHVYQYEVELKEKNSALDLNQVIKDLGLPKDERVRNKKFWVEFDKRVNYELEDFDEKELLDLIKQYLKK